MKQFTLFFKFGLLAAVLAVFSGCVKVNYQQETNLDTIVNRSKVYYAAYSFYYQHGKYTSANYRVGTLAPVNDAFMIEQFYSGGALNSIVLIVKSVRTGDRIFIQNVPEYSGLPFDDFFKRLFKEKPLELFSFSKETRTAIIEGRIIPGMTKEQVILSSGYPPSHRTPSLDFSEWTYWKTKSDQFRVKFNLKDEVESVY